MSSKLCSKALVPILFSNVDQLSVCGVPARGGAELMHAYAHVIIMHMSCLWGHSHTCAQHAHRGQNAPVCMRTTAFVGGACGGVGDLCPQPGPG